MKDETDKMAAAEATPNREGRRASPLIEGEALPDQEAPKAEPARAATALAPALPGLAALLLAGVALYLALNPSIPAAPSPEAVAALGQRLDRLEARLGALEGKPAPAMPDLTPLAARLDAAQGAAEAARADAGRALQAAQNAPKPPEPPKVDLAPFEQRIGRIEADLGPLLSALAAPKTEMRATASPNVQGVSPHDAATLAVVAGSLRQQLDRGAPFAREMSALERLGADPATLGRLKPLAPQGAPSAARLAQDFAPLAPAMLRAARPAPADGDMMDRLARSAASLVRIRPAGETAGEDAAALISRIEAALQRGDLTEALSAFDRLPLEAREPARDWAARARQRVEADAAARGLLDQALETLARK